MKVTLNNITIALVFFAIVLQQGIAQENVFLDRKYWKAQPSIEQVKKDISLGNDPTELNKHAFDAVTWALIEKVDNKIVRFLLEQKGNDVNKLTHDGRTYIFWAAYKDNLEIMQYLVDQKARLDVIDSHGYSVLNFAAVTGQQNTKLYDFLINLGANPMLEKNKEGANSLLLAAPFMTDDSLLNYFAAKGVKLDSKDNDGNGVFNYAAKKGNIKFLDLLIKRGVDYKTLNKKGGNAFIYASRGTRNSSNTLETYKYLEKLGLQPNVTTADGYTPLHSLAYKNTDLGIFNYFIEKGVDVNQADENGNTAFMNAASRNQLESVSFLASYINNIDVTNKKGQTALMRAVENNTPEVVEFLLSKGANTNVSDLDKNTLVYYLINTYRDNDQDGFDRKLKILQSKGLKLRGVQAQGNTVWHLAVKKNNLLLLKRIAGFKAAINKKNNEGLTPLHLAAMKAKKTEILKFLLENGADKTSKTDFDETVLDLASENELLKKDNVELNFLK